MTTRSFRRKNRLIKFYMNIPDSFEYDKDFAEALMETMDTTEWKVTLNDKTKVRVPRIIVGDIEIEPEDGE